MKPVTLYHCTDRHHGSELIVRRKSPIMPSEKEPDTPRLCACPSVAACIGARMFHDNHDVYVYRTAKKRKGITPRKVWDSLITSERWLIPPEKLNFVGPIRVEVLNDIYESSRIFHQETRKSSDYRLRIALILIAVERLPRDFYNRPSDIRFWNSIADEFGDPEMYILNRTLEEVS